ncbi:MAG TPA: glycosyltransferase family 1 protein [Longimicrobiales bacterium]
MRLGLNGRFLAAPVTGVQRFAREVGARLLDRVSDGVLFVPRGAAADLAAACPARVVRGRLAGHAWEQLELPLRARAVGCDVVLHPANALPVAGGPHVLVLHDALPLSRPEWFARAFRTWYRQVQRRAAARAAALVTVSAWARNEIAAALGTDPERISVVGQGIEPFDGPADAEAVRRIRERLRLPPRYLLTVGDGDPRKNIAFLHPVRERWRATRGDPPALVVVGAASPRVHAANGRAAPASRDDAAGVIRLGRVDDETLRALYTGAAAFCFPSLAEGFGRPPLEAMACGAPVVAAPYGPAREVLGDAARIVPLEPDAWVAALEPLLEPGPARDAARDAGRRHAAAFRWDDVADRLLEICRAAAAGRRTTGRSR